MPRWGSNKLIKMYFIVVNPSRVWAIFISEMVYWDPGCNHSLNIRLLELEAYHVTGKRYNSTRFNN
jgi:hypothetical protein